MFRHGAARADLLCGHLIMSCISNLMRLSKWWVISHFGVKSSFKSRPFAPAAQWLSSSLLQHSLPLSHQRVHTLIWIMFLLQVPPVINGVPFRTMAKSGLYWLTLIIDSRRLLPWFMIVCYFYISCQIHLVCPRPGSVLANSKHPAPCLLPPHREWALFFCEARSTRQKETRSGWFHSRFRKESLSVELSERMRATQTGTEFIHVSLWNQIHGYRCVIFTSLLGEKK